MIYPLMEIVAVIFAFTQSFITGIIMLGLILSYNTRYKKFKRKKLKRQKRKEKSKREITKKDRTPDKIYTYKNNVIEEYRKCYKIANIEEINTKEYEKACNTVYWNLKEVKKDIDLTVIK